MRECLLALFVAMAVTYLLTGVVRRVALAAGAAPPVRDRDVHATPTPRWGGIAMFGGLVAAMLVVRTLPMLRSAYESGNNAWALLLGAGLICVVGIIDDKWGMDSLVKLAGQILAAGVMVIGGIQITWLPIPGLGTLVLDPTTGPLLSILVVVVSINAVNFVDGLDGLAAGMVCIAALAFFAYSYRLWVGYGLEGAAAPTMIAAILSGMCLGFLAHNFHPAKIFMGDTGAMLIGLLLAATAITLTGQIDPGSLAPQATQTFITHKLVPVYMPLILPVAMLVVPLADLLMAVVRRTRAGRSPFAPDKQHLHHRLMEIGHSHRRAVLVMYFWSALVTFIALGVSVAPRRRPVVEVAVALAAVGMVILLLPRLRLPAFLDRPRVGRGGQSLDRPRVGRGGGQSLDRPRLGRDKEQTPHRPRVGRGDSGQPAESPGPAGWPGAAPVTGPAEAANAGYGGPRVVQARPVPTPPRLPDEGWAQDGRWTQEQVTGPSQPQPPGQPGSWSAETPPLGYGADRPGVGVGPTDAHGWNARLHGHERIGPETARHDRYDGREMRSPRE